MEADYPISLLHNRNLKATPVRLRFLQAIHAYGSAMPFSVIQKKFEATNRVTLYRTIETLLEKGIIHKTYNEERETYYALCGHTCSDTTHVHDHLHFECVVCEQITCEELTNGLEIVVPNAKIHKVNVQVKGVCGRCEGV